MPTYTATFRADDQWAEKEFEADTPEQGFAKAKAFYDDHDEELMFQGYDGNMPVNEIEISGDAGSGLAFWRDKTLRLHLAAQSLLDACLAAIDRLEVNNLAGEEQEYIDLLQAAITEATA